ncbi:unnamed protein product, partial [Allacma fusca]
MHSRTKHIDIRYHYIRDQVENDQVKIEYVPTTQQLADGLTKPLLKGKLETNRTDLGLKFVSRNKGGKTLSWTTFALLSMFIVLASGSSFSVSLVVWRRSNVPVTIGHNEVSVIVKLINPCSLLTNDTVHQDLTSEAIHQCNEYYQNLFVSDLIKMCPQKKWTDVTHRRKRILDLIILFIVVAIVASAGLGITAVAISATNSEKIYSAEVAISEERAAVNKLQEQVQANFDRIKNLTASFNKAMDHMEALEKDHAELKGKLVSSNFIISYLVSKLMIGRSVVQEASRKWKSGLVDPAFLEYFNVTLPCGNSCPISLAKAQRCSTSENGEKLLLEFAVPVISEELILVEADSFQLRKVVGNQTCTIRYKGAQNALISDKEHCTYSINVKTPVKQNLILAPTSGCIKQANEQLNHFSVSHCETTSQELTESFIQVKPLGNQYYVYCPGSNITLEGVPGSCPEDVFIIPMKSNFKINNIIFNGSRITIFHQETLDHALSMKVNLQIQPNFNWTSLVQDLNFTDPGFKPLSDIKIHAIHNYWSTGSCGL